jgi:hypothetical protein
VRAALLALCVACGGSTAGGGVVNAPLAGSDGAPGGGASGPGASVRELPGACSSTWTPEQVASAGQAVVGCGNEIARADLDPGSPAVRAILAGLDAARDRICACAAKLPTPASVELTVHARPEEGRATAALTEDEDLAAQDDVMRAFVACVGTVATTFHPAPGAPTTECPAGRATYDYPIGFPLGP